MEVIKQKIKNLFSRKFLLSAAIVAAGIGTALKTSSNSTVQIFGILTACVAACVYAIAEGMVDSNSIELEVEKAIEEIEEIKAISSSNLEETEVTENE